MMVAQPPSREHERTLVHWLSRLCDTLAYGVGIWVSKDADTFENIVFSPIATEVTGAEVRPKDILDPVFAAVFKAVLAGQKEHRRDNVYLSGENTRPCFIRIFPVDARSVVAHFHNKQYPWCFSENAIQSAALRVAEYTNASESSRHHHSRSETGGSFLLSGIGSADFQLPFPLSNHETSSSEWLPRPVMAPFECLTLAFVQWNYGGKCLAANSAALTLFGCPADLGNRLDFDRIIHPDDVWSATERLRGFVVAAEARAELKITTRIADATRNWIPVDLCVNNVIPANSSVLGYLIVLVYKH